MLDKDKCEKLVRFGVPKASKNATEALLIFSTSEFVQFKSWDELHNENMKRNLEDGNCFSQTAARLY